MVSLLVYSGICTRAPSHDWRSMRRKGNQNTVNETNGWGRNERLVVGVQREVKLGWVEARVSIHLSLLTNLLLAISLPNGRVAATH